MKLGEVGENLTELQAIKFDTYAGPCVQVRDQDLLEGAYVCAKTHDHCACCGNACVAAHLIWCDWQLVCYMYQLCCLVYDGYRLIRGKWVGIEQVNVYDL